MRDYRSMIIGRTPEGNDVELPISDFTTAGTAILAMRGAGKSWLAGVLVEKLAANGIPFVVVDPEGEYWTLRVEYSNVVIAGGEHADIPLVSELAEILGQTVVEERLQLVLDLSDMRRSEQKDFLSKFLIELFVKETDMRIPLWICFEEADLWVPQSGNPPCKVPVLDICQRGRKRGLGFALVSQRPATIDKTALSQAEFRFFKRFQQPHDLRAVKSYLGSYSERVSILPSLEVEDALFYAPTISESPMQIKVPHRICPHGGATPDQVEMIKGSTTTLELKEKIEGILSEKKRELNEIEKRDKAIRKLEAQISKLETEIEKIQLATDVAEILSENKTLKNGEFRKELMRRRDSMQLKETNSTPSHPEHRAQHLRGNSVTYLGPIGVNSKTGFVLGNSLADLLLNRLSPDERVVFLAIKDKGRPSSATEISRQMAFSARKTRRLIKDLKNKGLLKRVGRNSRGILYQILL